MNSVRHVFNSEETEDFSLLSYYYTDYTIKIYEEEETTIPSGLANIEFTNPT